MMYMPLKARLLQHHVSLQGHGLGNRLLKTSINFCREKGDSKRTLDILEPARHLYAKFGFHKTESKAYNEWNESREMYHETWECELE